MADENRFPKCMYCNKRLIDAAEVKRGCCADCDKRVQDGMQEMFYRLHPEMREICHPDGEAAWQERKP